MIYPFDPENARDRLIEELRSLAAKQGFSKVVVGISGGKVLDHEAEPRRRVQAVQRHLEPA